MSAKWLSVCVVDTNRSFYRAFNMVLIKAGRLMLHVNLNLNRDQIQNRNNDLKLLPSVLHLN